MSVATVPRSVIQMTRLESNASVPQKRPLGVLLFGLYFLITAVANVAMPILIQARSPVIAHAASELFGIDWDLNLVLSFFFSLLGFSVGLSLLLLRRAAMILLQTLFVVSAIGIVWHFLSTKTLQVIGPLALLSPAFGLGILGWALVYTCRLMRRSVLL
jgi:hypothetical protein